MASLKTHLAALLVTISACGAIGQEPPPPVAPIMREVSPGIYEIGRIHLDQKLRTARFAGEVNMKEGIIEYLLVTTEGNTHESLLVTEVQPNDLHFAMLLLGAKVAGLDTPAPDKAPPPQIDSKYLKDAPKLRGDAIAITVNWKSGDAEKTGPVEDWIFNTETKKPMARGPWIYTGSMFSEGHFLAQLDGAFAALVTYPAALINNPRRGSDNDQIWTVNEKAVPAVKTPVDITIQLLPNVEPKPMP
jgi:hypothetical protein